MNATLVGVLFATVCLGVMLFLLGKRGWKLNDHPQCRDCGFDLGGVYPATVTCPECGSGLKREKAVRKGVRRRMGWLMALGVLVVLLPLAPLVTMVYAATTGTNLAKYTPTGVLLWQTRVSSPAVNKQIADELIDRLIKKQLDKGQSAAVAERALEIQGDREAAWDEVWGDVIERLNLNGDLSKAQLERFRKQSVVLSGSCRASVRAGDVLPIAIQQDGERAGGSSQFLAMARLDSVKLGDTPLKRSAARSNSGFGSAVLGVLGGGGVSAGAGEMFFYIVGSKVSNGWMANAEKQEQIVSVTVPKGTEPGVRTLTVTVLCRVDDQQGGFGGGWNTSRMKASDPSVASFTVTRQVTVLPPEADPVKLTTPTPEQEKEMRSLLRDTELMANVGASGSPLPFFGGVSVSRMVSMQLEVPKSAPPFAFEVFIRIGDKETRLGEIASKPSAAGAGSGYYMGGMGLGGGQHVWLNAQVPGLKKSDKKADLIFRPSTKVALETIDLAEIYGGEVVLKNVSLRTTDYQGGGGAEPAEEPETSPKPEEEGR